MRSVARVPAPPSAVAPLAVRRAPAPPAVRPLAVRSAGSRAVAAPRAVASVASGPAAPTAVSPRPGRRTAPAQRRPAPTRAASPGWSALWPRSGRPWIGRARIRRPWIGRVGGWAAPSVGAPGLRYAGLVHADRGLPRAGRRLGAPAPAGTARPAASYAAEQPVRRPLTPRRCVAGGQVRAVDRPHSAPRHHGSVALALTTTGIRAAKIGGARISVGTGPAGRRRPGCRRRYSSGERVDQAPGRPGEAPLFGEGEQALGVGRRLGQGGRRPGVPARPGLPRRPWRHG